MDMSRFWKVQRVKNQRKFHEKESFYWLFFWRYKFLLFVFFCLHCAHPWSRLHHVLFYLSHVSGINHQTLGTRGERSTIYDVKIKKFDHHKHLWHLKANRGAREMITNCDRTENIFIWNSIYIMIVFWTLFVGHRADESRREWTEKNNIIVDQKNVLKRDSGMESKQTKTISKNDSAPNNNVSIPAA